MRRIIIFIPAGETEPVSVTVVHDPDLDVPGIWHVATNEVYLSTELWNQFPANDQHAQRKVFDQLLRL